jgi:hypothetical protein
MNAGIGDFDIAALYRAVEDRRLARDTTWVDVARDINSLFRDAPSSPISVSTLRSFQIRTVVEGDGVLQVLRWLDVPPEMFMHLVHGGRTSFPLIGRIAQWLGCTTASLVRVTDR